VFGSIFWLWGDFFIVGCITSARDRVITFFGGVDVLPEPIYLLVGLKYT
jgi:hypothetical protein